MSDRLDLAPTTLRKANDFVAEHHPHNGRTARNGGKFAISVERTTEGTRMVVGVAIVGNPLSATYMDGFTAEVLRVCTTAESPKNVCSMLYAACWRAWKAMGGRRLITYTLASESGVSVSAAGWSVVGESKGSKHAGWKKSDHLDREYQEIYGQAKFRWEAPGSSDVLRENAVEGGV